MACFEVTSFMIHIVCIRSNITIDPLLSLLTDISTRGTSRSHITPDEVDHVIACRNLVVELEELITYRVQSDSKQFLLI